MSLHSENVLPIEQHRAGGLMRSERTIGAILLDEGKLTHREVEQVLERQRADKVRFGEAAVRLGFITEDDVRFALAKQYDMPHFTPSSEGPSRELVAAFAPFHPRTEEMRALRTQLLIRWYNPEQGRKSLVVASPERGEGRSYVAANLAIVFSQLGARTLLVDADLRKPRQHKIFGLPEGHGLSSLLAGRSEHTATFPVPGLNRLSVLPAGPLPPNPQELLSRPVFNAFMKDLQGIYDVIIIDTPPTRHYADAQSVTFRAGDALVVARKNHTAVALTSKTIRELAGTGARVVGTVVNEY
ncbi:MAG: chain length determinant protein tyrosine kinase EpsG [Usitatibacter sp.]